MGMASRVAAALLVAAAGAGLWSGVGERPAQKRLQETGATVSVSQMPPQGQQVLKLIHSGGPFPYDKDGAVFGNRERLLPIKPRGYYREYTVASARARSRGAQRIVCGGSQPTLPDTCYYTKDHYSSFKKITEP